VLLGLRVCNGGFDTSIIRGVHQSGVVPSCTSELWNNAERRQAPGWLTVLCTMLLNKATILEKRVSRIPK